MFQHTAARRRLDLTTSLIFWTREFQHTAARRRLDARKVERIKLLLVSTHSRPKAAGFTLLKFPCCLTCFNTQPPEGGWPPQPFKNSR